VNSSELVMEYRTFNSGEQTTNVPYMSFFHTLQRIAKEKIKIIMLLP